MPNLRLKYVVEDVDRHGNVRVYFRHPKKPGKIRLRGAFGTDQFFKDYQAALSGVALQHTYPLINRKSSAGTFRWLCESYFVSPEFIQLDPRTRRIRRNKLEELCINLGDLPIKGIAPKHIRAIRNAHQDRPEAANSILKIMRQLLTYAIDLDLLTHNPAKEVKYLPSLNSSGFHTWTEEEIAKYEAYHLIGSPALLAMALMLYTGQRKSDAVELGRQHLKEIDGKWKLCFSQKKINAGRRSHFRFRFIPS
jgi:integrase